MKTTQIGLLAKRRGLETTAHLFANTLKTLKEQKNKLRAQNETAYNDASARMTALVSDRMYEHDAKIRLNDDQLKQLRDGLSVEFDGNDVSVRFAMPRTHRSEVVRITRGYHHRSKELTDAEYANTVWDTGVAHPNAQEWWDSKNFVASLHAGWSLPMSGMRTEQLNETTISLHIIWFFTLHREVAQELANIAVHAMNQEAENVRQMVELRDQIEKAEILHKRADYAVASINLIVQRDLFADGEQRVTKKYLRDALSKMNRSEIKEASKSFDEYGTFSDIETLVDYVYTSIINIDNN